MTPGRGQRIQESLLPHTLGATQRQILQVLAVEYLALGGLAAVSGTALGQGTIFRGR